jgi:lipopolysaccharide heptosyltransferase III
MALGLPEKPSILVITLRRLGDVLMTTPLIRTLRRAHPQARIDVLVFRGSERILAGNPDIDNVLTVVEQAPLTEMLVLTTRIFRRYDLAITTQTGDRPTLLAWLAGRQRLGFISDAESGSRWNRALLNHRVAAEPHHHRVEELLRLADAMGLRRVPDIVVPRAEAGEQAVPSARYAVLHPNPMYAYKRWNAAGWRGLARALAGRGLEVLVSCGPDPAEHAYLDALWGADAAVRRIDWRLSFGAIAEILRGAAVYVGTDTSVSHLAAGTGCPTVTLFGPTDPRVFGPWPVGGLAEPWDAVGHIQRRNNVWVVQNPVPCACFTRLGCDGHLDSRARCLDELTLDHVLVAVDAALAGVAR